MKKVDAIIIGSGQGGVPLAVELSNRGKEVVIFERSRMGGSCINWGCTPSKAFLGAAHAAGRARNAEELGIYSHVVVDFPRVMERVRHVRDSFTEGSEKRLRKAGLTMVLTEASFDSQGIVHDEDEEYSAPLVVIDTGSAPATPPIPGLDVAPFLTDRNFWELKELPQRTLVLGAGYIGLELGQGLARLGSKVQIIDKNDRPMSREDPDVSAVLREALENDGVEFHLGADIERVEHKWDLYRMYLKNGRELEGDALLVAAGRRPNSEALNAPGAGIELDDRGIIKVNNRLETTRRGVYAIGEVAGQPAFTHVSWEDYRRLLAVLDGKDRGRSDRVLGYAAFTEPQVARAGLSLDQAKERGYNARAKRMEVRHMARAIEWGHHLGFYELVVDDDTDRIIGATLVGYETAELVHILLDLIETNTTWRQLDRFQHIHPTYAENLPSIARMFKEE